MNAIAVVVAAVITTKLHFAFNVNRISRSRKECIFRRVHNWRCALHPKVSIYVCMCVRVCALVMKCGKNAFRLLLVLVYVWEFMLAIRFRLLLLQMHLHEILRVPYFTFMCFQWADNGGQVLRDKGTLSECTFSGNVCLCATCNV